MSVDQLILENQKAHISGLIRRLPEKFPTLDIATHAELHRSLPPGTPRPGQLQFKHSPYLYEILYDMSVMSPIQRDVVMKGAQIGVTMAAESMICYYMGYVPADILFISATDALLERWVSRRLEAAINSYGYRDLIYAQYTDKKSSRRSGDTTFAKEYNGCRLDMGTANSAPRQRATDKRILVRDEIDAAAKLLTTGEGSWLAVSERRLAAWGNKKKILDLSTPTTYDASAIWPEYERGDQRQFYVQCPFCYTEQTIDFYRMHPVLRDGEVYDVYMDCENPKCKEKLKEHYKTAFYEKNYRWQPTKKSEDRFLRTRQISSLYSPLGMYSWVDAFKDYNKCQKANDMAPFNNTVLGMPHRETGQRPKLDSILQIRGTYPSKQVQDNVLYLTFGCDVQRGSEDPEERKENPPRLELEVVGHGENYYTASVEYLRFEGAINSPYSGAWEKFRRYIQETGLLYRKKDGSEYSVEFGLIDSGDGTNYSVVYDFCKEFLNIYPSKGFGSLSRRKGEKSDKDEPGFKDTLKSDVFKRYRAAELPSGQMLFEISTNYYKRIIYRNLEIKRVDGPNQANSFCDFPRDYSDKTLDMLIAEEPLRDGSFYSAGRRNELLDCRVMNLCAGDAWLDLQVKEHQVSFKTLGYTSIDLLKINHKFVIEKLKREAAIKSEEALLRRQSEN